MSASKKKKRDAGPAAEVPQPKERKRTPEPRAGAPVWFPFVLALLAVVLYWPAVNGPFVYDDYDMLEGRSAAQDPSLSRLIGSGRPALMATFALNFAMGGADPFWFHIFNILLHALNGFLLWMLVRSLLDRARLGPPIERRRSLFEMGLPLLFVVSPMQVESVAYISSRSEVLATTFYLAGLWAFVAWREKNPWVTAVLAGACFAGTALSKQDKLTLPFAILLMDYLLLSKRDWGELKKSWPTYGLFGLGIVAGFFVLVQPFLFAKSAGFSLDWQAYLFTQFRVLFRYMGQLVIPMGLTIDPGIMPSEGLFDRFAWLGLLALIGLLALAVRFYRQAPVAVFGGLFFLLAIAPTSSFYPLLDYAAERRVYLPAIGFFLLALWLLNRFAPAESKAPWVVLVAAVVVYSGLTMQRSAVWASELDLWTDAARKAPEKARPLTWLGRIYFEGGRTAEAVNYWTQAEEVVDQGTEEHGYLLANLGLAAARAKDYAKAIEYYREAVEVAPWESRFWAQLAVAQMRAGQEDAGWESFAEATKPGQLQGPQTFMLRAQEYYRVGKYAEAARDYEAVLEFDPSNEEARRNLEVARRAAGS